MAIHMCLIVVTLAAVAADATQYSSINGLLCISSEFVETHWESQSDIECATLCGKNQNCQAFSTVDGPCQLFVFTRCSKSVRNCSCSRSGQVYVKQQPGLSPGALCPADYGYDRCGVKYKMFVGVKAFSAGKAAAEAEPGLVIMADAMDQGEVSHISSVLTMNSWSHALLGSLQLPGSVEPAGGWFWTSCNLIVSSSLWTPGEPNNGGGTENTISVGAGGTTINDYFDSGPLYAGIMVECLSPFT